PGFLLAVLMWHDYVARMNELAASHKPAEARALAASAALAEQQAIIALPRRFSQFVRDVWGLQHRLEAPRARTVPGLIAHERFRAAYDFLVLRGEAGEGVAEAAAWWTAYQAESGAGREALLAELRAQPAAGEKPAKRRRRRRRKRPEG